ncbi:hypothetical protein [Lactobacillus phage phiEF-1.1]|nr:hypothetical protein [Lactobacillus phage phiEF-1.1]
MLSRVQKKNQEKQERKDKIRFWTEIITFIILIIDHVISWF